MCKLFLSLCALWISLVAGCADARAKVTEYTLVIDRQMVNVTGHAVKKLTVNGSIPAPLLHFTEGDDAVIHVINKMDVPTSIHWHGLLVPGLMDGVTGFNGFPGIKPGGEFTYRFRLRQNGTYWYHSHTAGQEQEGLYGGVVIDPKGPPAPTDEAARDETIVLSDFTEESPAAIMANLKRSSDYYAYAKRTQGTFWHDIRTQGLKAALSDRISWGHMRMARTDLSDVSGYTYLFNGEPANAALQGKSKHPFLFKPNERVRLRFINASAMTIFDVRIPNLRMAVVAADGKPVFPVTVDEFRFGPGETYDVIVMPRKPEAYAITAEAMDRSGMAIGALVTQGSLPVQKPDARPRALLTMADMDMKQMMKDDPGMKMTHEDMQSGWSKTGTPKTLRLLAYSDLEYRGPTPKPELNAPPERTLNITLGGNMQRYIWTLNGKKFSDAEPIRLRYGERVRLTFVNETMMAHPMHLHGMYFRPEFGKDPAHAPFKHTIIVPPAQTVSALLTADEPGEWPLHCHLLYHMTSGMMRKVEVLPEGQAIEETHDHAGHNAHTMMKGEHGDGVFERFIAEQSFGFSSENGYARRFELDAQAGTDEHKLWIKADAGSIGNEKEGPEAWALYSRNVLPFWDLQAGVRGDLRPNGESYFVAGINGLAPYYFETEAHAFISSRGEVSFRLRQENDLFLTQRAIFQPFLELNASLQDSPTLNTAAGLQNVALGGQLRYEFTRSFAPFIAIRYERLTGENAGMSRKLGDEDERTEIAVGLRVMF